MNMNFLLLSSDPAPYLDMGNYLNLVSLIMAIIIFAGFDTVLFFWLKRSFVRTFLVASELAIVLFWLFGLDLLLFIVLAFFIVGVSFFFLHNSAEGRKYVSNNVKKRPQPKIFRGKPTPEALFDREAVYKKVADAVLIMSKKKIGALITFERGDNLRDYIAKGVTINCPVSSEILQTIFYPGTRLHDGAVIIRNDVIAAASVYYQTVDIAMPGKFGSRHRAALSISSQVDAVTVVVSEETGRISIAYEGEIQSVEPDSFLQTFEEYMANDNDKSNHQ